MYMINNFDEVVIMNFGEIKINIKLPGKMKSKQVSVKINKKNVGKNEL
jgi:hypothetical protein